MTSSRRRAALVAAVLALQGTAPAYAWAQAPAHQPTAQELETARTLYKEGKELRASGDLRGALEKLQAAHALGNTPVTGIELARTYVVLGKIVEAREVALYVGRIPVASDETEKSAEARADAAKLAEELRPRIPTLVVKIAGLGPGETAHLTIDGVGVPDAAVSEAQKVDPGPHVLVARAGEGAAAREAREQPDVKEGQTTEVTLTIPAAPAQQPLHPPRKGLDEDGSTRPSSASQRWVKIGFVTAISGVAVGLIAGVTALTRKGQLASECNANKQCPDTTGGASDLDSARTWATVSNAAFFVAGVGAVVGVLGLLSGKSSAPQPQQSVSITPWIGVGTAGVHGRF